MFVLIPLLRLHSASLFMSLAIRPLIEGVRGFLAGSSSLETYHGPPDL